ncbi:MAG: PorV/PorQ family protein [Bacteroidota bacterium]
MQRYTLLLLLLIGSLPLSAQLFPQLGGQRAGISALTFLKIEVSPRAAALAGASNTLTGDAYAIANNPASLAEVDQFSLGASNTFWVADINYAFLAANIPTKNAGNFAISLSGLNSGPMPVRTTFQPEGTGQNFYAYYLTAGVSYAKRLTDQFSWGASAKYVHEQLAEFQANTFVVDLGFLYETDFRDLRFAVVLENFGPNSTLSGEVEIDTTFNRKGISLDSYPAPALFKLGVSIKAWENDAEDQYITGMLQLNHPNDNSENIRLGLEYSYKDLLFLRAGYKINVADQNYPTAGIGLRMRAGRHPLIFDYALDPLEFLGNVHRVGLSFRINPENRDS